MSADSALKRTLSRVGQELLVKLCWSGGRGCDCISCIIRRLHVMIPCGGTSKDSETDQVPCLANADRTVSDLSIEQVPEDIFEDLGDVQQREKERSS